MTKIKFRPGQYKAETLGLIKPGTKLVVFDTETTGLKPEENDRIIEFACMEFEVREGFCFFPVGRTQIYIKPPFQVESKIEELTGITNEFLADKIMEDEPNENGVTPVDFIYEILSKADVCVGHNVSFDIRFVNETMKRNGKNSPFKATADTLKMAKDLIPKDLVGNYKNETLVRALHLTKDIEHFHSAADDVTGTARMLQKLVWAYRDQDDGAEIKMLTLKVKSVKRWEKDDRVRVYVNTDHGSVFFGSEGYIGSKDVDLERVDKGQFIEDVLQITGLDDIENILEWRE